jgi:hypothetical protein
MRYLFALLALAFGPVAFGEPTQPELKIQCQMSAGSPILRISLLNESTSDTAIVIGMSIGNGRWYVADSVVVEVKRAHDGPVEIFRPGGGPPAIAGRVDPWIVPLPAGSEFSLALPMAKLFSRSGDSLRLGTGEIFVRASIARHSNDRFNAEMVGPGLVKVFVGVLHTEWLRAPAECSVG